MPAVMPASVMRNSMALVTATSTMESAEDVGRLRGLAQSMEIAELAAAAICLARIVALTVHSDEIRRLGIRAAGSEMIEL